MSEVSAAQLAILRSQINKHLPDTCTLKGRTNNTLFSNVPCRVKAELRPGGNLLQELNTSTPSYVLTVPYTYTLATDMNVVHNGHEYEIDDLMDDQTPLLFKQARMARL